jgi:hypothetical protein
MSFILQNYYKIIHHYLLCKNYYKFFIEKIIKIKLELFKQSDC